MSDVLSWTERGIIRLDTIIRTPLESAFFDVADMPEFAFQFMFRRLGMDSNLLIAGTARHWPLFHLTTHGDLLRFARPINEVWQDLNVEVPRGVCCVEGSCFKNEFLLKVNGDVKVVGQFNFPPVSVWGVGSSPLMQGNADYGDVEIWGLVVSPKPLESSMILRGKRNTGYDYESLQEIKPILEKFACPSVIRVDVDNLGQINARYGFTEHQGDLSVDMVCDDIKEAVFGSSAVVRYQRRDNDEIVVFCEEKDAFRLAQAICDRVRIKAHHVVPAESMTVSCGIGATGKEFFPLYANAGCALRLAKHDGKNRVCCFDGQNYSKNYSPRLGD